MCEQMAGNTCKRYFPWIIRKKSKQKWIFAPAKMSRSRIIILIALVGSGLFPFSGHGQSLKLGLYAEPVFTWMSSSDKEIKAGGGKLGLRMGISGEYLFHNRWALGASTSLSINQGGSLLYQTGGNFWLESELKSPNYNLGHKPVPDNSKLTYQLQFWEAGLGLKYRMESHEEKNYYLEPLQMGIHKLLKARGAIHNNGVLTGGENILPDLQRMSLSIGVGMGQERRIGRRAWLTAGIRYQRFLSDLTLNHGFKSRIISQGNNGDPNNDIYTRLPENSNTFIHGLSIRLGFVF